MAADTRANATPRLHDLGQSLWLDNITRGLLTSGTLRRYIDEWSVTGLTSNPTIFDHAIENSALLRRRDSPEKPRQARPARRCSSSSRSRICARPRRCSGRSTTRRDGLDGWVSLEVSPLLANDTASTIKEAAELHARAKLSNLLIKIPGTPEGVAAIEASIAAGVPVNVTLLFSREQYLAAADAYMRGIERRVAAGLDPNVGSVASIFISRWDKAVMATVPTGASQSARDCRREAHLRRLPRAARLAAMADAVEGRGAAAAPPVGEHQHEGPQRLRCALHRSPRRAGHDQHHPRGHAARLCRSWSRHPDDAGWMAAMRKTCSVNSHKAGVDVAALGRPAPARGRPVV